MREKGLSGRADISGYKVRSDEAAVRLFPAQNLPKASSKRTRNRLVLCLIRFFPRNAIPFFGKDSLEPSQPILICSIPGYHGQYVHLRLV